MNIHSLFANQLRFKLKLWYRMTVDLRLVFAMNSQTWQEISTWGLYWTKNLLCHPVKNRRWGVGRSIFPLAYKFEIIWNFVLGFPWYRVGMDCDNNDIMFKVLSVLSLFWPGSGQGCTKTGYLVTCNEAVEKLRGSFSQSKD